MIFKVMPLAVLCVASSSAFADAAPANRSNLGQALQAFLSERGEICLAKYDWPVDVSARDVAKRTRDALQLPVLESEGLVRSREGVVVWRTDGVEEPVPTRRYELTELGRQFYKIREFSTQLHGATVTHHGDLCAGRLALDAITVITEPLAAADTSRTASASYRYRFTPEPWASKPQVRAVFPMIDTLIREQGRMEMSQGFHFDGRQWVADTKLE